MNHSKSGTGEKELGKTIYTYTPYTLPYYLTFNTSFDPILVHTQRLQTLAWPARPSFSRAVSRASF